MSKKEFAKPTLDLLKELYDFCQQHGIHEGGECCVHREDPSTVGRNCDDHCIFSKKSLGTFENNTCFIQHLGKCMDTNGVKNLEDAGYMIYSGTFSGFMAQHLKKKQQPQQ